MQDLIVRLGNFACGFFRRVHELMRKHGIKHSFQIGHFNLPGCRQLLVSGFQGVVVGFLVAGDLLRDGGRAGQQAVEFDAEDNVHDGASGTSVAVCERMYPVELPEHVSRQVNGSRLGPVIVYVFAETLDFV